MHSNIEIIDNFLDCEYLEEIQNLFIYQGILPWYYNTNVVFQEKNKESFQFTHTFYNNFKVQSSYYNYIEDLIYKLNPISLIRVKSNLLTKTDKARIHDYHTDIDIPEKLNSKTAIFYINSNNGKTLFLDGEEVESIENRLVIFDSKLIHTGTTCTDEKVRVLINFNYF